MFGFDGYVKHGDVEECVPMKARCMVLGTIALAVFGFFWFIQRSKIRKYLARN
jgi:hypothetical protein